MFGFHPFGWIKQHAGVISAAAGALAIATAPIPIVDAISPVLGAISVGAGALATANDLAEHKPGQAIIDGLGTVFGAGGLLGDTGVRILGQAAKVVRDNGGVARVAGQSGFLGDIGDGIGAFLGGLGYLFDDSGLFDGSDC